MADDQWVLKRELHDMRFINSAVSFADTLESLSDDMDWPDAMPVYIDSCRSSKASQT